MSFYSTKEGKGLFSRTSVNDTDIENLLAKFECVEDSLSSDLSGRKKDFLINLSREIKNRIDEGNLMSRTEYADEMTRLKKSELSVLKELVDKATKGKSGGRKTTRRKCSKKRRRSTRRR